MWCSLQTCSAQWWHSSTDVDDHCCCTLWFSSRCNNMKMSCANISMYFFHFSLLRCFIVGEIVHNHSFCWMHIVLLCHLCEINELWMCSCWHFAITAHPRAFGRHKKPSIPDDVHIQLNSSHWIKYRILQIENGWNIRVGLGIFIAILLFFFEQHSSTGRSLAPTRH